MVSYVDDYCLLAISVSWQQNTITLTAAGNQLQLEANQGGLNFDLSKTELFQFPRGKNLPTVDLPGVQFGEHHIANNLEQRWVGVFFDRTIRPTVTNPDPDLELTRDPPAPVLYWQPTQLPSYFRVHLDLVITQQDLYLLTLFLWILFSD